MLNMRLALYQPEIPPNVGTILRLCACENVPLDIIEPCGFPFSERSLKRAGMDYIDRAQFTRHQSWDDFKGSSHNSRIILLSTQSTTPYTEYEFSPLDILLFGQESAGVPPDVHDQADARLCIPMKPDLRSLNVAVAAAMVLGEALRQTNQFPSIESRTHEL
ncbi:MAG: tRNA (cytidine(34)-2'-O)-methyltransferase [Gammaproteobacteria bacterium]